MNLSLSPPLDLRRAEMAPFSKRPIEHRAIRFATLVARELGAPPAKLPEGQIWEIRDLILASERCRS
jgi:hypothetical protein